MLVIDIENPGIAGRARASATSPMRRCWPAAIRYSNGSEPDDEWQSICLLYTSGTTGDPKGAVYSHRGAYLQALSNALMFGLNFDSVYLWTLPMFHCSGWSYPWAVVAVGGTQVCLRKVDTAMIFQFIAQHHVTHLCGAPIVLNMLAQAPAAQRVAFSQTVNCATGGAAPPSSVLRAMEEIGFRVTHLYGATETYGPATSCVAQPEWNDLSPEQRYANMARQGVAYPTVAGMMVADPETMTPVPRDGTTMGELMMRGNTVMKGYLANPEVDCERPWSGTGILSGDLAVWHPDGYIEIKDRSKDIIISGGENISNAGSGGSAVASSRGIARRRGGAAGSDLGRNTLCVPGTEGRCRRGHRDRHNSVLPAIAGSVQSAQAGRVRRHSEDIHGQDPEIHACASGRRAAIKHRADGYRRAAPRS